MAIIKAFQCIRPVEKYASQVAALPYDVYSSSEACEVVKKQPLSFLKIDRAETAFGPDCNPYDDKVYQKAHDLIQENLETGIFMKDQEEAYYIYQLIMNGRSQTGIVACASIDDYINGVIKKHENTRSEKEEDRIKHVEVCNAQTGPIFLAYRSNASINQCVTEETKKAPLYHFVAEDGITHNVWKVTDVASIITIKEQFEKTESIYIADGHHRAAAAVKVGQKKRAQNTAYTGEEEWNFFLSVLFPDDQLMIMDYNRCVSDLNGYSTQEFLAKVQENFTCAPVSEMYSPKVKGEFGMLLENQWYKLMLKDSVKVENDPVSQLDVSILHDYLIEPVLGIDNPKVDKRIDFIGGIRGLKELEKRVNEDMKVAFSMYPTDIGEVFAVSDAGLLMPPKSTWFEPKLRSGLFLHEL